MQLINISLHLRVGSVKVCGLTPRAADLGYAPRYLSVFSASSFFRFGGESTLPPQAANASRWAVLEKDYDALFQRLDLVQKFWLWELSQFQRKNEAI